MNKWRGLRPLFLTATDQTPPTHRIPPHTPLLSALESQGSTSRARSPPAPSEPCHPMSSVWQTKTQVICVHSQVLGRGRSRSKQYFSKSCFSSPVYFSAYQVGSCTASFQSSCHGNSSPSSGHGPAFFSSSSLSSGHKGQSTQSGKARPSLEREEEGDRVKPLFRRQGRGHGLETPLQ